jgi:hypothetical protein
MKGSKSSRGRRMFKTAISAAVIVGLVFNCQVLHAGCDIMVMLPADNHGLCNCVIVEQVRSGCDSPTKEVRLARMMCKAAPCSVVGQENCRTKQAKIGDQYTCYVGTDGWYMLYCAGTLGVCASATVACALVCAAPPWAQCIACFAGATACKAAMIGSCGCPCCIEKCYVDDDSRRDLVGDVFDRFDGGQCTGPCS